MINGHRSATLDERLEKQLQFDSLAQAEKITGLSYKEDQATMGVGLFLHLTHSQNKRNALKAAEDSYWSISSAEFLSLLDKEGFQQLLMVDVFQSAMDRCSQMAKEIEPGAVQYIFWHPEGVLMVFDTYKGEVNSSHAYFNLKVNDRGQESKIRCSKSYVEQDDDLFMIGSLDCREGFRLRLRQLRSVGSFVTPWIDDPMVWLSDRAQIKSVDKKPWEEKRRAYDAFNHEKLSSLPTEVQKAVTPNHKEKE